MRSTYRALATVAAMALLAAACGSATDQSVSAAGSATTDSAAEPTTETAAEPTTPTTEIVEAGVAEAARGAADCAHFHGSWRAAMTVAIDLELTDDVPDDEQITLDVLRDGISIQLAGDAEGDLEASIDVSDAVAAASGELGDGGQFLDSTFRVMTDGTMYLRIPDDGLFGGDDGSGDGPKWIALPADDPLHAGHGLPTQLDMDALLCGTDEAVTGLLPLVADLEVVGVETVRGVSTTRRDGTVLVTDLVEHAADWLAPTSGLMAGDSGADAEVAADVEALVAGLSLLPEGADEIDVRTWVDDDGRLRRLEIDLARLLGAFSELEGDVDALDDAEWESSVAAFNSALITVELYDIGADFDIQAPPADELVDLMGSLWGAVVNEADNN